MKYRSIYSGPEVDQILSSIKNRLDNTEAAQIKADVLAAQADVDAAVPVVNAAQAASSASATAAAASASAANTSATNASNSATQAASSAANANATLTSVTNQANIVANDRGIFATTTAGIAATTNGQYFWVPSTVPGQALILYQNSSGSAVVVTNVPNTSGVSSAVLQTVSGLPAYRPSQILDFQRSGMTVGTKVVRAATGYMINRAQDMTTALGGILSSGRIDHDPITGAGLGLLLEDSCAQLCKYTEDFTNAYWTLTAVTLGASIQPLGVNGVKLTKVIPDTTNGSHNVKISTAVGPAISSGSHYVASVFLKAAEMTKFALQINPTGVWSGNIIPSVNVDLSAGTLSSPSSSVASSTITAYKNGVYRVCIYTNAATNNDNMVLTLRPLDASFNSTFTGDGVSGIYVGGANVFQTNISANIGQSYVFASSSAATRDADILNLALSGWFNSVEGTFVIEHDCPSGVPLLATNGSNFLTSVGAGRTAISYSPTGTTIVQAGGSPTTSGTVLTFGPNVSIIPVGRNVARCKRVIYYAKALSTALLQLLTSV